MGIVVEVSVILELAEITEKVQRDCPSSNESTPEKLGSKSRNSGGRLAMRSERRRHFVDRQDVAEVWQVKFSETAGTKKRKGKETVRSSLLLG